MRAKGKYAFEPDYAVPPGVTLREVMEFLQMSQKELAQRTELTGQYANWSGHGYFHHDFKLLLSISSVYIIPGELPSFSVDNNQTLLSRSTPP